MIAALRRVVIMAEMHGRDLTRRHVAMLLLVALPLSFYLASTSSGTDAILAGGVGMAFSVSGATLFSVLSSTEVDQRLVLCGFRPVDLLLGRLLFLGPLGSLIAGAFSVLMASVSHPAEAWVMFVGVVAVALMSIPFGLAVGAAVPRELEGTLILIGVVGLQLSTSPDSVVAKVLPFFGPREVIAAGISGHGAVAGPLLLTAVYGLTLMVAARILMTGRVEVVTHGEIR